MNYGHTAPGSSLNARLTIPFTNFDGDILTPGNYRVYTWFETLTPAFGENSFSPVNVATPPASFTLEMTGAVPPPTGAGLPSLSGPFATGTRILLGYHQQFMGYEYDKAVSTIMSLSDQDFDTVHNFNMQWTGTQFVLGEPVMEQRPIVWTVAGIASDGASAILATDHLIDVGSADFLTDLSAFSYAEQEVMGRFATPTPPTRLPIYHRGWAIANDILPATTAEIIPLPPMYANVNSELFFNAPSFWVDGGASASSIMTATHNGRITPSSRTDGTAQMNYLHFASFEDYTDGMGLASSTLTQINRQMTSTVDRLFEAAGHENIVLPAIGTRPLTQINPATVINYTFMRRYNAYKLTLLNEELNIALANIENGDHVIRDAATFAAQSFGDQIRFVAEREEYFAPGGFRYGILSRAADEGTLDEYRAVMRLVNEAGEEVAEFYSGITFDAFGPLADIRADISRMPIGIYTVYIQAMRYSNTHSHEAGFYKSFTLELINSAFPIERMEINGYRFGDLDVPLNLPEVSISEPEVRLTLFSHRELDPENIVIEMIGPSSTSQQQRIESLRFEPVSGNNDYAYAVEAFYRITSPFDFGITTVLAGYEGSRDNVMGGFRLIPANPISEIRVNGQASLSPENAPVVYPQVIGEHVHLYLASPVALDDMRSIRVYANGQSIFMDRGFARVWVHGGDYYLYSGAFEANRLTQFNIYRITATYQDTASDAFAYVRTAQQMFSSPPSRPPLPPPPPPELPPDYCEVCEYELEDCICDDPILPPDYCEVCEYELEDCICDDLTVDEILQDIELYCNLYSEWRSAVYGPVSVGADLDMRIVTGKRLEPEEFAMLRLRAVPTGNDRWGQPSESAAVSITSVTFTAETATIFGETKYVYATTITVQEWSGGNGPWYRIVAYLYGEPDDFVFAQLRVGAGASEAAFELIPLYEEPLKPEDIPYPPDYDIIKDDKDDYETEEPEEDKDDYEAKEPEEDENGGKPPEDDDADEADETDDADETDLN